MRAWAGIGLALALSACAQQDTAALPKGPLPLSGAIAVRAEPVPLDPTDPARDRLGDFVYAGGVALTSTQTSRLHGLSDLQVWPDGRLLAQGDESDQLEARIVLDAHGRLTGLADARLSALKGPKGDELFAEGQKERDAEGIAEFANGDRIVSFEEDDRILLYPKGGAPPRPAPYPQIAYVFNKGMEGLVADPSLGPDAYRVGIEKTGQTFICRLSAACQPGPVADMSGDAYQLSGMEVLAGGRIAYLLRAFDPVRWTRVALRIVDADNRPVDSLTLARPLTVDNFEGVAAMPRPGGVIRFYLISDDNFSAAQRTLLLAFDWTPPKGGTP